MRLPQPPPTLATRRPSPRPSRSPSTLAPADSTSAPAARQLFAMPTAPGPLTAVAGRLLAHAGLVIRLHAHYQSRPCCPPPRPPPATPAFALAAHALPSFLIPFSDGSASHKGGVRARIVANRTWTGGGGVSTSTLCVCLSRAKEADEMEEPEEARGAMCLWLLLHRRVEITGASPSVPNAGSSLGGLQ